jgi:hypothetical protein
MTTLLTSDQIYFVFLTGDVMVRPNNDSTGANITGPGANITPIQHQGKNNDATSLTDFDLPAAVRFH